jgi:GAF domain-containing protein
VEEEEHELLEPERVVGVLDVDSPKPARFEEIDARGLEEVVRIFLEATDLDT